MDDVARRNDRERRDLFLVGGERLNLAMAVVEKDFWGCWLLKRVFSLPGFEQAFVFKGGTCLSKVYKAIDRFSEDVDLVWNREFLGFSGARDPFNVSQNKAEKELIPELIEAAKATLNDRFVPTLKAAIEQQLEGTDGWSVTVEDDEFQPSVRFHYPTVGEAASRYIAPFVVLELVPRSEPEPSATAVIKPYAAEAIHEAFQDPAVTVTHIHVARTFWEKATILHMYHNFPEAKSFAQRSARHYYDVFQLIRTGHAETAKTDVNLLKAVVRHKKRFYRSGPAKYDDAAAGNLKLVPPSARIPALRGDYAAMSEMMFGEQPGLDEILDALGKLEQAINAFVQGSGEKSPG